MKIIMSCALAALFFFNYALPARTNAAAGPSANGDFWFSTGDGVTRYLRFNAKINPDGTSKGEMTYVDPAATPDSDPDGGGSSNTSSGVTIRVEFDCLVVDGNKAVMSGVIVASGFANNIGQRVLLTVEDNGEGVNAPASDRLSWGVYRNANVNWVPSDVENPHDPVPPWLVTDGERCPPPSEIQPSNAEPCDPNSYPSNRSTAISCNSFPLSSYSFLDLGHGNGNIQVRPRE